MTFVCLQKQTVAASLAALHGDHDIVQQHRAIVTFEENNLVNVESFTRAEQMHKLLVLGSS